jgi:tetratricopeptide (TPR) repeat protein
MKDLARVAIVLLALLALGAAALAQSSRSATGSKTTKAGRTDDNHSYPSPSDPEGARNASRDLAIPYAGTISIHEMSIQDRARKAYNKGVQQFKANDWGRSVLNAQRAIKFAPAFYEAYNLLGLAEASLENWDLAEAAYRKSIELSGDTFATPHFGLGMVLSQRAQFVEAEATILEGLRLDPADAKGHCGLALVLYLMGRFTEAERSAREAIRYQSTYSMPYFLLAKINHLRGNPAAEIEDLKTYLKVEPAGPLSVEARAVLADAEHSLAKGNTATPTKP